jgi:hypothetical protein
MTEASGTGNRPCGLLADARNRDQADRLRTCLQKGRGGFSRRSTSRRYVIDEQHVAIFDGPQGPYLEGTLQASGALSRGSSRS